MFKKLNTLIRKNLLAQRLRTLGEKETGQVAIILIVVIAIALIFYAVTLNLGSITRTKTQITIAANSGAGLLASQMASYGHQIFMVELGGKFRQCRLTGTGFAIFMAIAAIITALSFGAAAPALVAIILMAAIAAASITLDQVVIQPGLDAIFNKNIALNLDQASSTLESGIRAALQTAISDSKRVLDEYDGDSDTIFGGTVANPDDEISRFGVYYLERLKSIQGPDTTVIQAFINALRELIYEGSDGWGFYDPVGNNFGCLYDSVVKNAVPTVCNKCCLPLSIINPDGSSEPMRDTCCDPPCTAGPPVCNEWPECGQYINCGVQQNPPLGGPGLSQFPGGAYPDDYDPYYENPTNPFVSFREQLGRDDEHIVYEKDQTRIPDDLIEQSDDPTKSGFIIEDTTGYLNFDPLFGGTGFGLRGIDRRPGIYPFFYKIRDWGYNLATTNPLDIVNKPNHCYWYAPAYEPLCNPYSTPLIAQELVNRPLVLPNDPATLVVNTTPYVDPPGIPPGVPLAPDAATLPGYILGRDDFCGQSVLYPNFLAAEGFWKPGSDRYCSTNWPYFQKCLKHGPWGVDASGNPDGPCQDPDGVGGFAERDCTCMEAGSNPDKTLWPDDGIDELVYYLPEFFEFAERYLPVSVVTLARNFIEWYPEAAEWIEPGLYSGASKTNAALPCYICEQNDGFLWRWVKNMTEMSDRLKAMLAQGYAVGDCTSVWCAPQANLVCPAIMPDEAATMGVSNIPDIIACLTHNENNATRFQACLDVCFAAAGPSNPRYPLGFASEFISMNNTCGNKINTYLPRSLLGGFDANADFVLTDIPNMADYFACPDYCGTWTQPGPPAPGSCMGDADLNFNNCTTLCNNSLIACLAGCGGSPACITGCNNAHNICMNGPPATRCNPKYATDKANCECVIRGVTYECDQPVTALYLALNTDAEAAGFKGSCKIPEFSATYGGPGGGFFDKIEQSIPEAENQAAKFRQRRIWLEARMNEINFIIGVLDTAIGKLNTFLRGPAADLIRERINYKDVRLPYHVIYGWQGDPPPRPMPGRPGGLWHIVKVEARIPGRCDDACDASQSTASGWPRMRSYRRFLTIQRCYELTETDGTVKIRVTRYDEQKPSSAIYFPNGMRIWDFRNHPDRSPLNFAGNIAGPCPPYNPNLNGAYNGAFLVNDNCWKSNLPSDSDCPTASACWGEANRLLQSFGVESETCAKYYYQSGDRSGFDFQFVPCRNF